jgi:hypothetical protein
VNNSGSGGCAATGNTFQNDDELAFSIGANETWNYRFVVNALAGNTGGIKFTVVASGSTTACSWGVADVEQGAGQGNIACGGTVTTAIKGTNAAEIYEIMGTIVNTNTSNTITLQWAQNTSGTQTATVYAGSFLQANRILAAGAATLQAFVDNGNSFAATADLGTNDAYDLNLLTNGQSLANFSATNGSATFKNWSNSTAGFQIQTSGGSTLLAADTTNSQIVIGKASTTTGNLAFANSGVANTVTLSSGSTSSSYTIQLPTSSGSANQCLQYGGAGGTQLQWGACGTNSTGLAKNSADSSSASVSASSQLYSFTNSASATAGSVLKLDNGTNTNSTLIVTASGNPTSGQAIIFASNTNASPSGNLIDLQSGASPTSKFSVSAAGAVAATSYGNITGTGALTVSSGGATTLTLQSGGAAAVNLDTGGAGTITLGGTNATSLVLGGNTSETITAKVANSSTTAFQLQTAGATNYLVVDSTNGQLLVGTGSTGQTSAKILVLDTDTNATFRGATSTNSPTEADGAMYYSSSDHAFMCGVSGQWQTCNGKLYSNSAASTAVNTCTNGCAAFDTSNSSTIPANYCQAGRVINIHAAGVLSTTGTPTIGMEVRYGTDATTRNNDTLIGIAAAGLTTANNSGNLGWIMDYTITCFSTTSMNGQGIFRIATSTTATSTAMMYTNTATTVTSTSAKNFYIFPTWGTSNLSNTITAQQLTISGQ